MFNLSDFAPIPALSQMGRLGVIPMERLSLSLLGPLRIALDGRPVSGFAYNKARALLLYLAVEADRPHQRDALVDLLWPDLPDTAARTNLRQVLTNLREAIGDATATPPFLLITRDTIQLNPSSGYELDIISFTTLLDTCATHSHRHLARCRSCAARMQQALAHYHGDFLAEFALGDSAPFDEWALRHREQLHQRALDTLAHLADYYERCGDDEPARRYAQRQIELDPWREEAHRQLMRLLARGGQRSAALAQYEACHSILARDLGVAPESETNALYEHIRDRETGRQADKQTSRQAGVQSFSLSPLLLGSPAPRHNFPAQTTPLIGRETELAELGDLLENPACRLITITGPGGIGKTRLALAAATEQAQAFANGAAFVPLAAISAAEFVAPAIMAALGLPLQGQRNPRDQLLDYLHAKELLLVLDNFEQLLGPGLSQNNSAADLLTDMLQHAPGITLVITSRERLALQGEWLFDLPGLSYPTGKLVDDIESYGSAQLFLQRAGQVRRQFALAEGESNAVARICRLVEGLPLAIELAAAALRVRSCAAIADAIETNLSALTTVLRSIPERHRSVWATFEYSWGLLSDEERLVFPRLAVFRGGFTLEAVEAVCRAQEIGNREQENIDTAAASLSPVPYSLLPILAALVDKSLLRWDGADRYDMHELVRQYASEKLEQAGETERIRRQHATYFLALAEVAEPEIRARNVAPWLDRIATELYNFRATLWWSRTSAGDCELGLRIAGALEYYWMFRNSFEGRDWLEGLLAQEAAEAAAMPQSVVDRVRLRARAKALGAAGMLAEMGGALALARVFLEESTTLFQNLEEMHNLADSLFGLAHLAWTQGAAARAAQLSEECLRVSRVSDDVATAGRCLWLLSNIAREQGDLARAQALADTTQAHAQEQKLPVHFAYAIHSSSRVRLAMGDIASARAAAEEALALGRQLGHTTFIAHALLQLGRVAEAEGDQGRAVLLWEQGIGIARDAHHLRAMAEILLELGWAEHQQGNNRRARILLTESLRLYRDRGHQAFIAECLAGLAGVIGAKASTPADACQAARLYGAADAMRGVGNAMLRPGDRIAYKHDLAAVRDQLGEDAFAVAWAAGRTLTLEQAIAEALAEAPIGNEAFV
jgi:predicted ATPase/DNA-binding SARP family transcriptional activator/tetratricopeptide (TPR) repeat protein